MPLTDQLGLSFLPSGPANGPDRQGARLEDVLRVLSFRLPRILGARPIAPQQLLTGRGGQGDPLGSAVAQGVVTAVLRGAPSLHAEVDRGAPSPLSQLFAPIFGPGQIQGPADLPSGGEPQIHFGPKPPAPAGGGDFRRSFDELGRQLTRSQRGIF